MFDEFGSVSGADDRKDPHQFQQLSRKLHYRDSAEQEGEREVEVRPPMSWPAASIASILWKLATNYCNKGLPGGNGNRASRDGQPLSWAEQKHIDVAIRGYDAKSRAEPPTAEYLATCFNRETTFEIEEYLRSTNNVPFGPENIVVACCQLATDSLPRVKWGVDQGYEFEDVVFDLPAFQLLTYMPSALFHEEFTKQLLNQLWPDISERECERVASTLIRMYIRRTPPPESLAS